MKSHSFRNRLIASFLVASLVPMVICAALLFHISRLQMANRTQTDAQIQGQNMSQSLDRIAQGLSQAGSTLENCRALPQILARPGKENTQMNSTLFLATEGFRDLGAFQIYDAAGIQRYSTRGEATGQHLPLRWGILYEAAASDSYVIQAAQEQKNTTSPLLQGAVALRKEDTLVGFLVLDMAEGDFSQLLGGKYGAHNDILILNEFWHPVYASQAQMTQQLAPILREKLLSGTSSAGESENYIYTLVENPATGLSLILRQPQMFSDSVMRMLCTAAGFCALMGIAISSILSLSLSRQVLRPIRRLQKAFSRLGQDDLSVQVKAAQKDELGQLAQAFNEMVEALKWNRQELIRNQQELNKAQVRMLQAQLNPHFLCNTLDTMKWISKINNLPQLALMSTNLADILRFCISAEEFVPLSREVQVLNRYIEIQKIRLSDTFAFSVKLPEDLVDCLVPKMILQPLVENAILHGVDGGINGWIRVSISQDAENLVIQVQDNGQGLPEAMLAPDYDLAAAGKGRHLGLYNVDTILKKHYGTAFGLTLANGPEGVGAWITATLPMQRKETAGNAEGSDCGR